MKRILRIGIKLLILGVLDIILLVLFWFGILMHLWDTMDFPARVGGWVVIGLLIFGADKFVWDTAKVEKVSDGEHQS